MPNIDVRKPQYSENAYQRYLFSLSLTLRLHFILPLFILQRIHKFSKMRKIFGGIYECRQQERAVMFCFGVLQTTVIEASISKICGLTQ